MHTLFPYTTLFRSPAGTVSASVAATGTTDPVIGPADVNVAEGTNTIVYAWGSLTDGNLALAVQTVGGMNSTPDGVPAGSAGLVATNQPADSSAWWFGGAALALVLGISAAAVYGTRRAEARR